MEDSDPLTIEEMVASAPDTADMEKLDTYMRDCNSKLPEEERYEDYILQEAIDSMSEEQLRKFGFEALQKKLGVLVASEDALENVKTCKQLISKYLMGAEPSEVDEALILLEGKFNLTFKHVRIITKFYKEEKRRYDSRSKQASMQGSGDYDMDSTSGRAKIIRDFADIYLEKQKQEGRPLKCINGKLRVYTDGIYPESDEILPFIKKEIVEIGLANGVNMTPNLIASTISLIETACPVLTEDCEPDKEFVVVLNNGILDTRNWKFRAFNPEEVYFSKIPVNYEPDAPTPTNFMSLVNSCFKGNESQIDLLQEAFGYCLTKTYKYQSVFYLLGDGGNGKGSITGILTTLLGAENVTSFSLYQLTDGEHIDYNIAMMHGKYANICGDVSSRKIVNTENLKKLSSNTDLVTGRHVREKPFQFVNYAKMFFLMNRAPESDAHTVGDNRRVRTIRFVNSFAEKAGEIKNIHKVIIEAGELPGILNWAIEGLKRLEQNGDFTDTRTVAQRAIEYDKTSNTMRYFVEECLYEDPGNIVPNVIMYEAYNKYRVSVGGAQLGERELKKLLMAECKEAGWNGVTNVQKRASQMPASMKAYLEDVLGVETCRCFYGVGILKKEPQRTVPDYCVENEVEVCESDADAYDSIMKEMSGNDGSANNLS